LPKAYFDHRVTMRRGFGRCRDTLNSAGGYDAATRRPSRPDMFLLRGHENFDLDPLNI